MRGKSTKAGQCKQASNTSRALDSLADRAKVLHRQHVESWLECAGLLREARRVAKHGEWGNFLVGAGIGERTARRMLRAAESGVKSDTMTDLGGVAGTMDALANGDCALLWWRAFLDGATDSDRPAILQSRPDGPLSVAKWCEFGDALADATDDEQVAAAWKLAPWRLPAATDSAAAA